MERRSVGQFGGLCRSSDLREQRRRYPEKAGLRCTPISVSALVALSFSGAIGLTFLMLGCALEDYGNCCFCLWISCHSCSCVCDQMGSLWPGVGRQCSDFPYNSRFLPCIWKRR
ncbi:leptin receptor gene-related protein isoform X3 [Odocoileus virginianus]|uniref:Leptin receptor gene-related protein isoform X3 n=1 Tax=Odocoileus virginianus TaxID=9874 RepID=A0ABM4I8I6_ODOVR